MIAILTSKNCNQLCHTENCVNYYYALHISMHCPVYVAVTLLHSMLRACKCCCLAPCCIQYDSYVLQEESVFFKSVNCFSGLCQQKD